MDSGTPLDGVSRSIDGDASIFTSSEFPDQSIPEEDFDCHRTTELSADGHNIDTVNNNDISTDKMSSPYDTRIDDSVYSTTATSYEHLNSSVPTPCNGSSVSELQRMPVVVLAPSRVMVFLWAFFLAMLFFVITLLTVAIFILEFDTNSSIISNIQALPEVCAFRRDNYAPWRNWILPTTSYDEKLDRWKC